MSLFAFLLGRVRVLVITVAILLSLLQVVLTLVARSIETSGQFAQLGALMPPFVRALIGPAIAAFLSFSGFVSLGYFEPAVLIAMVGMAIAVGTRPAADVESGFADLLLARSVPRSTLVTQSALVCLLAVSSVLAAMLAGTWMSMLFLVPPGVEKPAPALILGLAADLGLLGLCWSAIGLAAASASSRRAAAVGKTSAAALVTFLIDYIARLWQPIQPYAWISPFTYFRPMDLVNGGSLPLQHVLVLGGISLGAVALAYVLYLRRDITR